MEMKLLGSKIVSTGSFVPEKILTNKELEGIVDTSDDWIVTRTGIKERRISGEAEATSDLATKAALNAMDKGRINSEEIDLIIVATITPDMSFPSTACIVQKNIGASNAAAFDISAACTGFIYGVAIADQMIKTGLYKTILVIGAETLSKFVDWTDRNTCVLFGDGAGAVILKTTDAGKGIITNYLGSDGLGKDLLKLPGGGSRHPATIETISNKLHYISMKGNEVYKFAVKVMGHAADVVIKNAGLDHEDIDLLIPHQANIRIVECAAKKINLPMEKVFVNLQNYGNTSAASIPIALDEAVEQGRIKDNDTIVLVGFGGGLTWGATLIKWTNQ